MLILLVRFKQSICSNDNSRIGKSEGVATYTLFNEGILSGYINEGIFLFTEYKRSVVDILLMTLRITDKLISALLFRLEELEADSSSNIEKRPLTISVRYWFK